MCNENELSTLIWMKFEDLHSVDELRIFILKHISITSCHTKKIIILTLLLSILH